MSEMKQTETQPNRQRARRIIAASAAGLALAAGVVSIAGCSDSQFNPKVNNARAQAPAASTPAPANSPSKN